MKILKEGKLPEGTVRFECTFRGVELFKAKQRLNRESGC